MILKSQKLGFQFICKHCLQYAKNPTICDRCETLYCYECLNQQPRQYQYDYQHNCTCKIMYSQTLHFVEQYVANQLSINCSICGQLKSINKIKSHQAKCHQKEQEAINFFQHHLKFQIKSTRNQQLLICSYCNQNQFEKFYLLKKHNDQIVCRKCIYFYFNPDQKYSVNMSEELVCSFQQLQLQCYYCMKNGNYYEILNHNFVCSQYFTECQCGWSSRRSDFLDHVLIFITLVQIVFYLESRRTLFITRISTITKLSDEILTSKWIIYQGFIQIIALVEQQLQLMKMMKIEIYYIGYFNMAKILSQKMNVIMGSCYFFIQKSIFNKGPNIQQKFKK
ncbi:hypothetical protein pb186bvf_011207 [Paramecium bursaria]